MDFSLLTDVRASGARNECRGERRAASLLGPDGASLVPPRQTARFAGAQWCRDHRGDLIGWLPEVVVADPRRVAFVLQEARDPETGWNPGWLTKPEAQAFHRFIRHHAGESRAWSAIARRYPRGVYYDFAPEASWLSAEKAFAIGRGSESIFSIRLGEVAIYFRHEPEEYLCLEA